MKHYPSSTIITLLAAGLACGGPLDEGEVSAEQSALNAPTSCGLMRAGEGLRLAQSLRSCDGRFLLVLQADSNLVLYHRSTALIATNTVGRNAGAAVMQGDGNFVVYSTAGQALWNTGTWGHPGAYLAIQNDGNAVIYDAAGRALWASNTVVGPNTPPPPSGLGGSRPAILKVPQGYSSSKRYPLILELHGRGGSGDQIEPYFRMKALSDSNQIFVIAPNGTFDAPSPGTAPSTFWNATDGCCNVWGSKVDDVAYLRSLIDWTKAHYSIDPKRVYVIGISNGGFMAQRMACDASDLVAGIISIAGTGFNDPSRCQPSQPVAMLHIHGTADTVVLYNGMAAFAPGPVPSAPATYEAWAQRNGCAGPNSAPTIFDFDSSVSGAEAVAINKSGNPGCRARTELWALAGGGHVPMFNANFSQLFINWFLANPKL